MHISIWKLLQTECPNIIYPIKKYGHCIVCKGCTASKRCFSNDFVKLLSETSVASLHIISFFLLQRSLSSHESSHLFKNSSKILWQNESPLANISLNYAILQQSVVFPWHFNFKHQFLNWQGSDKSWNCFLFQTLCMVSNIKSFRNLVFWHQNYAAMFTVNS